MALDNLDLMKKLGGYRKNRETGEEGFTLAGLLMFGKYDSIRDVSGKSVCRNTSLQQMFMMLGSAEKAGSGADKILKGWEHQNWKNPYLIENAQPNEVELVMPLDSLMDKKIVDHLESIFGTIVNSLGKNEILVLSLALTEEMVYNERLQSSLNMHPADITRLLQKLCRQGFLTTTGHGRGTQYRLTAGNPKSTSRNPISPAGNPISTSQNPISLEENPISEVPKYVKRDELKKMVLDFCSEWRTAAEIAQHVGRTRNYITADILPEMADVLTMAYPQSKRNPNQKYIRKETEGTDDMSELLD